MGVLLCSRDAIDKYRTVKDATGQHVNIVDTNLFEGERLEWLHLLRESQTQTPNLSLPLGLLLKIGMMNYGNRILVYIHQ